MTEYANWHVSENVVVTTYGDQPCPHAHSRAEILPTRVLYTIPRAIVLTVGGERQAICATCVAEGESKQAGIRMPDFLIDDTLGPNECVLIAPSQSIGQKIQAYFWKGEQNEPS